MEKAIKAYFLLIALGWTGAHRFYTGQRISATLLLGLAIFQMVVIFVTAIEPTSISTAFYYWPPYAAVQNISMLSRMLSAKPTDVNQTSEDIEGNYVAPVLWVITTPALAIMLWNFIDLFFPSKWLKR